MSNVSIGSHKCQKCQGRTWWKWIKTTFADFSEPWKWVPDLLELFKGSNYCPLQGNSSLLIRLKGVT